MISSHGIFWTAFINNIEVSYLIHDYQERPEQPEEGEEQELEKVQVQEGEAPGK